MPEIYLLALVISLAAGLALVVSRFKQPLLVSYVATGALLSAFHIIKPEQLEFLAILPEVGLAFLLFLVGMELDLKEFRSLGKKVVLATAGQVTVTTLFFTFVLSRFGIGLSQAFLIGLVTAFTSTILVVKILLEEKELSSLHGKLSIGILLVEDLLAILVLMFLAVSAGTGNGISLATLVLVVVKGAFLIWAALVAGKKILPRIFTNSAHNPELLLLTAVGWCLLFVSLTVYAGFSLPIGAFLAGVSLGQSVYRIQISGRIKPLRDFFIMLFFLDLGTGLSISGIAAGLPLAVGLLTFAVIIKPLIFFFIFIRMGFRAHAAFLTGIYISSVSEFSLIVVTQASRQQLLDPNYLSPIVFATVFSFVFSSFLITHRQKVFSLVKPYLKKLERPSRAEEVGREKNRSLAGHAVLVGCHRSGQIILKRLLASFSEALVVLDFNPDVIDELRAKAINCLYGDVADPEILEQINLAKATVVVSTIRDYKDNLVLLDFLEKVQSRAAVVMTAEDSIEAIKLYERGAHHVSLPTNLEGHSISRLIAEFSQNFNELIRERERKLGELKKWPNL